MVSQLFSSYVLSGEGMANRKVSVWKYVKVGNRWKYCRPVYGRNNKIKPNWAFVGGKPEHHPEGNFYISRRDGKKKIWRKIGPNPADAVNAAKIEKSILNAKALGTSSPVIHRNSTR
jgi:integrase/recombinase XerD